MTKQRQKMRFLRNLLGFAVGGMGLSLISCLSLKQDLDYQPVNATISTVEKYLQSEEAKVSDIVPGTNKRIVWAAGAGQQTEYALVYFPGYSATRQEIAPIPERVARALGMNLFEPRFKGNGIDGGGDSYKGVTVQDHLRDAYEALSIGELLGRKIVLMGTSTGAPFAIWLADRFPEKIAGFVFVSPNNQPADSRSDLMLGPFGKQLAYMVTRGYLRSDSVDGVVKEIYRKQYSSEVQHVDATLAMMGIVGLVRRVNPAQFRVPYLMIYSERDIVVSVKAFKKFFNRYGKKTRAPKRSISVVGAPGLSQHGMVGDLTSPLTTQPTVNAIVEFLRNTLGKPLPGKGEPQSVTFKELNF